MKSKYLRLKIKQGIALGLVILTSFQSVLTAQASVITPSYDETLYITLDDDGNIEESSVVKRYTPNGSTTVTDYGSYESVTNLSTESTAVTGEDGSVTFTLPNGEDSFYFEGKTNIQKSELPWDIQIRYFLNNVEKQPQDLAGASGLVRVSIDFIPSKTAPEYYRNHMALTAATAVDMDKNTSFRADGAQIQSMGNMKAMVFIVIPGEEQHLDIEIGSDNFEFSGLVFLMMPLTLAQLDQISDLRDAKETIEDSSDALNDSLDIVLDSLGQMQSGLDGTINGLRRLDESREIIQDTKDDIYAKADTAREDLSGLSESLAPFTTHMDTAREALDSLRRHLSNIISVLDDMAPYSDKLNEHGKNLSNDVHNLVLMMQSPQFDAASASFVKLLQKTESDLAQFKQAQQLLNKGISDFGTSMAAVGTSSASLSTYAAFLNDVEDEEIAALAEQFSSEGYTEEDEDYIYSYLSDYCNYESEELETLTESIAFMLSYDRMDGEIYDDREEDSAIQTYVSDAGYELASSSNYTASARLSSSRSASALSLSASQKAALAEMLKATSGLAGNTNLTDNIAAMIQAAEQVLQLAYAKKDNVTSFLTDASDFGYAASHIFDLASDLTYEIDELNRTLDYYHEDAKQALADLGTMTDRTSRSLSSLYLLLTAVENQLKAVGEPLNDGTQKTLNGLADSLEQLNGGLAQTNILKSAKDTLKRTIDDKWDEYTGDYSTILNLDPEEKPISMTSSKNPSPDSIQIVVRTLEITAEEDADAPAVDEAFYAEGNFFQRILNIFKEIWRTIVSIFQ